MSRRADIFTESEKSEEGSHSDELSVASGHSNDDYLPNTKREAIKQVERSYKKLRQAWKGEGESFGFHNVNNRMEHLGACIDDLNEFASSSDEESESEESDDDEECRCTGFVHHQPLDYSMGIQFHVENMCGNHILIPPRTSLAHIEKVIEDLDELDLPSICRTEITYEYCCRILKMKTSHYEETAEMFSSKPMAEKLIRVIEKVDHEYKAELLDRMKSFLKAMEDPLA